MSFEPDKPVGDTPIATAEPPKSNKKIWLFGGCGCLFVLLLICGGAIAFALYYIMPVARMTAETMSFVQTSQVIEDKLGTGFSVGQPTQKQQGQNSFTLEFPVEGPNGKGTVFVTFTLDPESFSWSRDEFYLEFEGERFDLDPDAELNLEIDDGSI